MPHLLLVSDTHNQPPAPADLPAVDVVVHAGDATLGGTAAELWAWVEWLRAVRARGAEVVAVGGNHDGGLYEAGALRDELRGALRAAGVHLLEGSGATAAGLTFWGGGWTVPPSGRVRGWAWPVRDAALERRLWAEVPADLDVLVTHSPPARILDRGGHPPRSLGSAALRWRLDQLGARAPRLHVFGHIHESAGALYSGPTLHVNAAYLDGRYQPRAEPLRLVNLPRRA